MQASIVSGSPSDDNLNPDNTLGESGTTPKKRRLNER